MNRIPEGDTALITDIDVLLLTPDIPAIIEAYAARYPEAVLTCLTNRISPLSRFQLYDNSISSNSDIRYHIELAERLKAFPKTVTKVTGDISGFLMVIPKSVWQQCPFEESGKCLGVDTYWNRKVRAKGIDILRMDTVYVWHTYRIMTGIGNKNHLT